MLLTSRMISTQLISCSRNFRSHESQILSQVISQYYSTGGRNDAVFYQKRSGFVPALLLRKSYSNRFQHQLAHKSAKSGSDEINNNNEATATTTTIIPSISASPLSQQTNLNESVPTTTPTTGGIAAIKKKPSDFIFFRFLRFIQGYSSILEKKFPGAMHVYRVFVVGFKDFSRELGEYVSAHKKALLSINGMKELTRKELDLYYRMPKEMFKVGPTLLISALPFANYVVFPIAYYFPKYLLSSHFWSIEQKSRFALENQRKRQAYYRPVFRYLQDQVTLINDPKMQEACQSALYALGSGGHPTVEEIMKLMPLFEKELFSLKAIYGIHCKKLCKMHGIHTWYLNRSRLRDHAEMIFEMDTAIIRDGLEDLKPEELRTACNLRGLNAANTTNEEMIEFLEEWTSITATGQLKPKSYSLLLHLPLFLAYNNPSNWALKS